MSLFCLTLGVSEVPESLESFSETSPADAGADPARYGRTGQQRRPSKHLEKKLRKQIEREMRAAESEEAHATLNETLISRLDIVERRVTLRKLAAGYTPGPDGQLARTGLTLAVIAIAE